MQQTQKERRIVGYEPKFEVVNVPILVDAPVQVCISTCIYDVECNTSMHGRSTALSLHTHTHTHTHT